MAAASMVRQAACNQSKPSLALKTQESSPLNLFSIPSRVSFGAKSEKGLVVNVRWQLQNSIPGLRLLMTGESRILIWARWAAILMYLEDLKRKKPRGGPRNAPGFWNIPTDEKGEDGLFAGLSNPFTAGRYRSLVVEKESFPGEELEVTAWTEDGLMMAARHGKYKHLQRVQFHPESIVTSEGKTIVRNFIRMAERKEAASEN